VESTTPSIVPVGEPAPTEAKTEAPRTEKRGRRPEKIEAAPAEKPKVAEKAPKPDRKPKAAKAE
jgi:hypothetical protein